jgi:hypothetical protein
VAHLAALLLASGEVTLTAVRLLGRHLTPENHQAVLAKAKGRSRQQIEVLVAELAPRPNGYISVESRSPFARRPAGGQARGLAPAMAASART